MVIRNVLLVDDEEDLRRIGQLGLSVVGKWQVVQAENGNQALEKARANPPDLILLDVLMPGMDGPTTCERLKADEATRHIPIIFLTANTQPHEIDRYLELGAAGVIRKPFDPMTLAAEVRRILGSHEEVAVPHTILIVDDDPQFRALARSLLERAGHTVLEASRAGEAMTVMKATPPNLLLVDGLLPDTDGLRWIRKLRADGVRTPIAFASAFFRDLKTFHELTRELGVGLVLRKPIMPATFLQQLEPLLAQAPAAPEEVAVEVEASPNALLEALRLEYLGKLPSRLDALEAAIAQWRLTPLHPEKHDAARKEAHKLRGTAGSYGFLEVGEAAGRIEDLLMTCGGTRAPNGADVAILDRALAQARLATVPAPAPRPSMSPPVTLGPQQTASSRVLVVDDADDGFLEVCKQTGRAHGLAVTIAKSADEALAKAQVMLPDAVLLDVHLQSPSFALAAQLRAMSPTGTLPLAFCSADDTLESRVAAAHAGASLYLTKPVAPERFVQAMRELTAEGRKLAPHVLVVDDDEALCARIAAFLDSKQMKVKTLSDPTRILEVLESWVPELVLLDVEMPGLSGFDLCRLLRTTPEWRTTPVIFMTAHTDVGLRLAAFEAGGDDYLVKPVVDPELVARLRVRLEHTRLLKERAERDNLTGLLLRGPFVEQVAGRLAEAVRHKRAMSVALVDLDRFKQINDTAGHLAGDRVLSGLGELLLRRFRVEDLRARWGGDEFALAFPGESAASAAALVGRVVVEFAQQSFRVGEATVSATLTAGVASFPEDGSTLEALLSAADRRLYAAKAAGRNRVVASEQR